MEYMIQISICPLLKHSYSKHPSVELRSCVQSSKSFDGGICILPTKLGSGITSLWARLECTYVSEGTISLFIFKTCNIKMHCNDINMPQYQISQHKSPVKKYMLLLKTLDVKSRRFFLITTLLN